MNNVIAIGALGGSGTRAVTQIIIDAGIYMGDDLNNANDNLIFTRLFKDPPFYKTASKQAIKQRFNIFNEYMQQDSLTEKKAAELIQISSHNPTFQNPEKLSSIVQNKIKNTPINRKTWGWKEPNTQIYIEEISAYFKQLKYIHVVRHGLDMAFSKNKQQLINWGYKYNIYIHGNETQEEIAVKQLDYWVKSTKEAIEKGKPLGSNFLLLNHSDFCHKPIQQVDKIIDFLSIEVHQKERNKLYKIPKRPDTLGRYKKFDLGIFNNEQLEYITELGFDI